MNYKASILKCLKIAKLELEKVIQLFENNDSDFDVIDKISIVSTAMHKADELLLQRHVKTCAGATIKRRSAKKSVSEIMAAYKYV